MPATLIGEAYLSRSRNGTNLDLIYLYFGTDDGDAVRSAVLSAAPATHDGLYRRDADISVDPAHVESGDGIWVARVPYSQAEWGFNTGADSYFFDTGGGTATISHSIEVPRSYKSGGGSAPDITGGGHGGPIGKDGAGTDVPVPQFQWEETHIFSAGDVDETYKDRVSQLTGRVNDASFTTKAGEHCAEGEALFLGAHGGKLPDNTFAITFKFAKSKNTGGSGDPGLTVGTITGIQKEGWEYMDVWFEDYPVGTGADKIMAKRPKFVYIHQVFIKDDFNDLGIGP